jgi:hypothetical protein
VCGCGILAFSVGFHSGASPPVTSGECRRSRRARLGHSAWSGWSPSVYVRSATASPCFAAAISPCRRAASVRLAPGTRLGAFEIVAGLGAGGMGEVYRARDGKLDRDVAIKVLPQSVAADPDTLARLEREAAAGLGVDAPAGGAADPSRQGTPPTDAPRLAGEPYSRQSGRSTIAAMAGQRALVRSGRHITNRR